MNAVSSHRIKRRPPRGRARRAVRCLPGLVAAGVLIAGCGGGSRSGAGNASTDAASFRTQFVAYAACMRSHGESDYPDPQMASSGGNLQVRISPGSADPNSPAFKFADHHCHNFLPNGGRQASSTDDQPQDLAFADCMRSHGVPNFPDADRDGAFTLPSTINEQAPQFERASHECTDVEPSSVSIYQTPPGS
jgi:hypothetical protein